jgi:Fungal protein kinase
VDTSKLTGNLTYKDRSGTILDWNLSFTANGTSSDRVYRSGTAAFMAPILLEDESIAWRTLGHDMESFFAVIIWIATLDYENEAAFQAKPLAITLLDNKNALRDVLYAKRNWLYWHTSFRKDIIDHFNPIYRNDHRFVACLSKLRRILYSGDHSNEGGDDSETGSDDPMKEDLFRMCMNEIDDYLHEKKGVDEMQWIDSHAPASRTQVPESPRESWKEENES